MLLPCGAVQGRRRAVHRGCGAVHRWCGEVLRWCGEVLRWCGLMRHIAVQDAIFTGFYLRCMLFQMCSETSIMLKNLSTNVTLEAIYM